MRRPFGRAWGTAAALLASAQAADAHIIASRLGDFYAGALHPLTDLQDLVLWIALGAFAWRSIAIRAFGSWIAAIGLMMGGFALAS
jgi:urease accessory protein